MSRYIDSLPTPAHVTPKKLIVLSAPRTGTHGLYNALKILGFKPYHMAEILVNGASAARIMTEGMAGELGELQPYGRKEFDKWFADYDIIIEMPFFMLQSTLKAYPDAEFLLVERTPEKWVKSVENTIGKRYEEMNQFPTSMMRYFDDMAHSMSVFGDRFIYQVTKGAGLNEMGKKNMAETYREYIATVKRSVPPEQLTVMNLEDGFGWEQICPLVGVPVPKNTEWPDKNTPEQFHKISRPVYMKGLMNVAIGMTSIIGPLVAAGIWYQRGAGRLPALSSLQ